MQRAATPCSPRNKIEMLKVQSKSDKHDILTFLHNHNQGVERSVILIELHSILISVRNFKYNVALWNTWF